MEALELGIKNLVFNKYGKENILISSIIENSEWDGGYCIIDNYGNKYAIATLEPIPLTEEWFNKNAPCQDIDGYNYFPYPTISNLRFYLHEDGYIQEVKFECAVMANYEHIKSVHLFQNLYWSLTGKELPLT